MTALIIGYGNDLRSDDGIGPAIARAIEAWDLPHVQVLAVPQLLPEFAERLAQVDQAYFVDAYPASQDPNHEGDPKVQIQLLKPAESSSLTSHHVSDPTVLLALSQRLYDRCPQAWWVMIPGVGFELGEQFSSVAEQGRQEALEMLGSLLREVNTHA